MLPATYMRLAFNMLVHSKLRSWLTIIGIVIGVAAVVAIISIGEGMQESVQESLSRFSADIITISPGGSRAMGFFSMGGSGGGRMQMAAPGRAFTTGSGTKNLTIKDILVLKPLDGVLYIGGTIGGRSSNVYYLAEKASATIEGVDPVTWNAMTTSELLAGRLLGPSDYNSIVIGSGIASGTFKQNLVVGRTLSIEEKNFKIVGILKESGMGGNDRSIIMEDSAARDVLGRADKNFDTITIKAASVDAVDTLMAEADSVLMTSRHVTGRMKDYSITSAKTIQENIDTITQSVTLFLAAIAAVSLLVGAVGIANTMFTTVLEKTREIGIMKAIGAKNRDIMMIFLLNSLLVGVVGGILGVVLGTIVSSMMSNIGIMMGMGRMGSATLITPRLILYAFGIAVGIGIVAGVVPAYRASKLKPVDALRYE